MADANHHQLSVARQCQLLCIHRSGLYYKPKSETPLNLELMELIDKKYTQKPFMEVPRMTECLRKDKNYNVNIKRIERLYKLMYIQAIGPKPNTSKPSKEHKVYPYLLRGLEITRANQVWGGDITYIPMKTGYMYVMAIIDLYSRYAVNWSVSNSMDAQWCTNDLEDAIEMHGTPEILNTDQGSQFTSDIFVQAVEEQGLQLSMDGNGRAIDNIFIERLWRSMKYEHVYPNPADTV
ncbi:MAG: IS3 family transposase [Bacteroidales bacterium]|nr:IS3 family transposase [Bacteroidales bacterium]